MLAKFVVDSHFRSKPKGGTWGDKSLQESEEDVEASATYTDPDV